jgi:hypothetical protein
MTLATVYRLPMLTPTIHEQETLRPPPPQEPPEN